MGSYFKPTKEDTLTFENKKALHQDGKRWWINQENEGHCRSRGNNWEKGGIKSRLRERAGRTSKRTIFRIQKTNSSSHRTRRWQRFLELIECVRLVCQNSWVLISKICKDGIIRWSQENLKMIASKNIKPI